MNFVFPIKVINLLSSTSCIVFGITDEVNTPSVLKADIPNLTKNKKTIDSFTSAVRNYEAAIKAYATVGKQSDRSQKARAQALLQYTNSKSEIDTTLGMAKLICTKGF